MSLFTLSELKHSCEKIYRVLRPSAQIQWPLLTQHLGTALWVKHENHLPTGAFKVRGGINYIDWLRQSQPDCQGIITATRGNHGQSQARAATQAGLTAKIVVPIGNAKEKNAAMRGFGAELIEYGEDFEAAKDKAMQLAQREHLNPVPPFHRQLVLGVATYAYELFSEIPDLDVVYVPIGCGSGICGLIQVRDLLGLKTKIVGVVSDAADAAKRSFEAGKIITSTSAHTFADGMAVRAPIQEAFAIYSRGAERIVALRDDDIAQAVRDYYRFTHNVAEGAGAAALAAAYQERAQLKGKKVAVILTGANIDTDLFCKILASDNQA